MARGGEFYMKNWGDCAAHPPLVPSSRRRDHSRRPLTEPCVRVRTRLLMPDLSIDSFQTSGAIVGLTG